jgi:hypothetical protein
MDIRKIAEILGCPVVERNASESWDYDGKTISDRWSLPCVNQIIMKGDHDFLHEVCHWLVADEAQRGLPEFGMRVGATRSQAYGPKGGPFIDNEGYSKYTQLRIYGDGLLSYEEQAEQELACWLMSFKLGPLLELSPELYKDPTSTSWEKYKSFKMGEMRILCPERIPGARKLALKGVHELRSRIKGII